MKLYYMNKQVESRWLSQIIHAIMIIMLVLTYGCASVPKPVETKIYLQTEETVNLDIYGHSAPLVIKLYQLKNPLRFNNSSFEALNNTSLDALGDSLIDVQQIEMRPAQTLVISQSIDPSTNYIGILAAYRQLDRTVSRVVIPVNKNRKKSKYFYFTAGGICDTYR